MGRVGICPRSFSEIRCKISLKFTKLVQLVYTYCRCCQNLRSCSPSSYKIAPPLSKIKRVIQNHQIFFANDGTTILRILCKAKNEYLYNILCLDGFFWTDFHLPCIKISLFLFRKIIWSDLKPKMAPRAHPSIDFSLGFSHQGRWKNILWVHSKCFFTQ